jgi:hypothetical protein
MAQKMDEPGAGGAGALRYQVVVNDNSHDTPCPSNLQVARLQRRYSLSRAAAAMLAPHAYGMVAQ